MTLQEHYNKIAVEGQEYDPYTTMYVWCDTLCFMFITREHIVLTLFSNSLSPLN
jgi:hypothetical protein